MCVRGSQCPSPEAEDEVSQVGCLGTIATQDQLKKHGVYMETDKSF